MNILTNSSIEVALKPLHCCFFFASSLYYQTNDTYNSQ